MGVGGSVEAATVEVIHSPARSQPTFAVATPGRVQPSSVACEPIWEYRRGDEWVALPRETQAKLEAQCAAGARGSPVTVVLGRNAWTADTQSSTMSRGSGQAPLPLRRRFELVDHAPSPIFERKPPVGVDEAGAPVPVPHTSIPVSLVATARAHESIVYCGTFSASGREVLTCARDGTMKLWEVDTGFVRVNLLPVYDIVLSCALSRRNNLAAIGTADSRVCMYRVGAEDGVGYAANAIAAGSTIEPTFTLPGHQHKVYGVAFTSDAKRLVSGSMDMTVRLWDTARGECLRVIEAHEKAVFSVTTSPVSPNFVLSASDDMTMVMHDLRASDVAGPPIVFRGHTATLWTCDMSYDETHLVSSGMDGQVLLWDKRNPAAPLRKIGHHDAPVHCVEFMPDANRVLSCARDSTWRMWSCEPRAEPEMLAVVDAHDGNVFKVSYNAARSQVLSCGADGDIKLWKLHE